MGQSKVAIRYAKSLLDLARERGAVDGAQEDMEIVASAYDESRDLQLLLQSPIIKADKKLDILKQIFGSRLGPVSMAFIEIITKKGREGLIGQIAKACVRMAKEQKHIYGASVTSASPLDDASRQKVLDIVKQLKTGTIELEEKVNPELIGGFQLRVGDQMIDASVLAQIRALNREFSENPYISEL